jgi:hypothetical protein
MPRLGGVQTGPGEDEAKVRERGYEEVCAVFDRNCG